MADGRGPSDSRVTMDALGLLSYLNVFESSKNTEICTLSGGPVLPTSVTTTPVEIERYTTAGIITGVTPLASKVTGSSGFTTELSVDAVSIKFPSDTNYVITGNYTLASDIVVNIGIKISGADLVIYKYLTTGSSSGGSYIYWLFSLLIWH